MDPTNTSMEIDEHIQGVPLLEQLKLQRESGRFCDVVFHVNHQEYNAHRNVLAACSPYFDSVFDINKSVKEHLSVVCKNNTAFEIIIDYMYTGKITIHPSNAIELLRLANHFIVSKLKEYCCEYLEGTITTNNCFSIKSSADMCGCPTLSQNCHYFILCNISEVVQQREILDFTFAKIEHILSNKLYSLRQEEKFQLILKWTKWYLVEREAFFKTLLNFVNWSSISLDEIYNSLKVNDIYVNSDTCLFQLLQVLTDNGVDFQSHIGFLEHLKEKIETLQRPVDVQKGPEVRSLDPKDPAILVGSIKENNQLQKDTTPIDTDRSTSIGKEDTEDRLIGIIPLEPTETDDTNDFDQSDSDSQNDRISYNTSDVTDLPISGKTNGPLQKMANKCSNLHPGSKTGIGEDEDDQLFSRRKRRRPKRFPFEQYEEDNPRPCKDMDHPNPCETKKLKRPKEPHESEPELEIASKNDLASVVPKKRGRKRKERMKCPKCDFLTCNESRLSSHVQSAHKTEDVFKCSVCEFSCQWNREYYRHMKCHFSGPPYVCDYEGCDYSVDRIQALLHHRMRHSGERPYPCTECHQRFRTRINLKTHIKSHSGEKPFQCKECNRCFATKGTLEQHSVTHSNHRPYLCELCAFSTKYQSHLILHKRVHKGEVFKCQYPECGYSTPKRSQLGCHMRTHNRVKSHMCAICNRGFIEKSHLVRHERIHLQEKPFKCELCDYSSTRRDKLKDHTRNRHELKSEEKVRKPRKKSCQLKDPEVQEPPVPEVDIENINSLPSDEIITGDVGSTLDLDDRDMLRSSVVTTLTTVTSPTTMAMLTTNGLDARSLGLLLPTVVTIDGRDDVEQDHFRAGLMVEQPHISGDTEEDDSHTADDFLEQGGGLHLQPLQGHTLQLQTSPVADFQGSVSQPGRASPEIPGLASLMSIF